MQLKMLRTIPGSPDGIHVYTYEEGREYARDSRPPLSRELADVFVANGWAEEVTGQDKQPDQSKGPAEKDQNEPKAAPGPAENKALSGGKRNKGKR